MKQLELELPVPALRLVQADLDQRFKFGMAKYGRPVLAGDGQDYLTHLYEEILDAAVYLKAFQEERMINELVSRGN
jgi:hypothetical protein